MDTLPKTPSFRLDGRRALVTGAGRGLGAAAAAALAEAGANVTAVARTVADLTALAEAVAAAGGVLGYRALDLSDIAAAEAAITEMGPFDILVNNAGMNRPAPFLDTKVADFDTVFGLNVRAAFFAARAVAAGMVAHGIRGSIVNLSSQMGHVGAANRSVYCATKHAVEGMSKAMAAELGAHGIRVNTLCPTFVETPMTAPFLADPRFRDYVLGKIKLGRLARVEDVMGAVVYLSSDASAMVTGSALLVDGGWTSTS